MDLFGLLDKNRVSEYLLREILVLGGKTFRPINLASHPRTGR
jgi:hypothetical protein